MATKKRVYTTVKSEVEATHEGLKPPDALDFRLSGKQGEAYNAREQFVLYGGAKGGGKSWFMCIWVFSKALSVPYNKIFFCRRRSVDFSNTTLETWKKCIPTQCYRIHEQKKKIFIFNGSVIDYGGLDDPLLIQSLNSAEYGNIAVDQAEEIEKDSFAMLRGTLRHMARTPDGQKFNPDYQVMMSANPAQCWLKNDFILNPQKGFRYIKALPTDNPYLPKSYIENLSEAFKHRPHLLAAYLHGSWDDLAGSDLCIRGSWIEEAKSRRVEGKLTKKIVVNDPAITGDNNVTFLMGMTNGIYHVIEELVIEHKRPIETAARLAMFRRQHGAQIIGVDSGGIGEGVVDGLNQLSEPVFAINTGKAPTSKIKEAKYRNLRSQIWWEAGDKFANNKVALDPSDFELARQLGGIRFDPDKSVTKMTVLSKADLRDSLGCSPDRADAFAMGLYTLDYVSTLDADKEIEAGVDRVGHGTRMDIESDILEDDYSGYNL